jgi:hypothetical protein
MQFRECQMFQRNILPLPSLSKRKPNRKSEEGGKVSLLIGCGPVALEMERMFSSEILSPL